MITDYLITCFRILSAISIKLFILFLSIFLSFFNSLTWLFFVFVCKERGLIIGLAQLGDRRKPQIHPLSEFGLGFLKVWEWAEVKRSLIGWRVQGGDMGQGDEEAVISCWFCYSVRVFNLIGISCFAECRISLHSI